MTAGGLLDELRALDLSTELHERIRDAIDRRKNLVHRTFEDPEPAKAINGGLSFDAVVERINRLAIDCGELAVELEAYAIPKLEKLLGKSRAELIEMVKSADPSTVGDTRERKQLEVIQAFGDLEKLSAALDELGISEAS